METTRRGCLKCLAILIGAGAVDPVAKVLIPDPRRKIWAVGGTLQSGLVVPEPRRIVFPLFENDWVFSNLSDVERQIIEEHIRTFRQQFDASMLVEPLRAQFTKLRSV